MGLPPNKKLSQATTKPAQNGKTNDVHVKICRPKCIELIAMAANIYDKGKVNRLVFPAQAIRIISKQYILLAKNKYKDYDVVITLLLMNASPSYYTSQQVTAIKKSIEKIKKDYPLSQIKEIRLCTVKTMAELTNYVNTGNRYARQIYQIGHIDLFAHGHNGDISLGYNLKDEVDNGRKIDVESMFFATKATFSQWSVKVFHETAEFYTWACRTGAPIEGDAKNRSLGYYIACHLEMPVYGFVRRSDYVNTWGNDKDRSYLRLRCWRFLPDLVQDIEKCNRLRIEDEKRSMAMNDIGAVWMDNGAVYPVCSGSSPKELPAGYYLFSASSIEPKLVQNI